jgi:hypothetical protein
MGGDAHGGGAEVVECQVEGLHRGFRGFALAQFKQPLNKSVQDLSEGVESGAGPDSATPHQALARSMRDQPSMARGRHELVQTFLKAQIVFSN